jgi:tRNA nucleotidyltransferase (CCA-adding enzyme)
MHACSERAQGHAIINAMSSVGLLDTLRQRLPPPANRVLQRLLRVARRRGHRLYLVGGSVRDLLLGRPQLDLDLTLENNAITLASELAEAVGGRLTCHRRFGTATVRGEGFVLDLAMARSESYARPGALPSVRRADLREDLSRRDFSINAMALGLTGPEEGSLVDPHDGQNDLKRGLVRVLHDASFQDDATRILRALRYAGRLGFRLDPGTRASLRRDRPYLETISAARLRRELVLILREERASDIFSACEGAGVLRAIHPSLRASRAVVKALREVAGGPALAPREETLFCLLASEGDDKALDALVTRLSLRGGTERALRDSHRLRGELTALRTTDLAPSRITALLERFRPAAVWSLGLTAQDPAGERALRFLREWRSLRPRLDGRALERLGVPQGPEMGTVLSRLREARLDGCVGTREEEESLARRLAGGQPEGPVSVATAPRG